MPFVDCNCRLHLKPAPLHFKAPNQHFGALLFINELMHKFHCIMPTLANYFNHWKQILIYKAACVSLTPCVSLVPPWD